MTMLVGCNAEALTITVDDARRVSGLDGAGAGMSQPFMAGKLAP